MGRCRVTILVLAAVALAGCAGDEPSIDPLVTEEETGTPDSTAPSSGSATTSPTTTSATETTGERTRWPVPLASLAPDAPAEWSVDVLATAPHDPEAFTQGLELLDDGRLIESTGRRGLSDVRIVDPQTGNVEASQSLEPQEFGEGLTIVDDTVIQLTWQEEVARRWTVDDLAPLPSFTYEGEGWGLCALDDRLAMTDGSATLTWRDPVTFAIVETVQVTRAGVPVERLNELECVDGHVVANIWQTSEIVVIEPAGAVVATIDATVLVEAVATDDPNAVLNGIAAHRDGTFSLTGKLWPTRFLVQVVAG
ncbi:MAG: glutaminyl-peptide cyclotransferase [Actinomycetota bacterium]